MSPIGPNLPWALAGVTLGVAFTGLLTHELGPADVISILVLLVALITLLAVYVQITRAKDQLGFAKAELELVRSDLSTSQGMRAVAQAQAAEAAKTPLLGVVWNGSGAFRTTVDANEPKSVKVTDELAVENAGERTAKNVVVHIRIPGSDLYTPPQLRSHFNGISYGVLELTLDGLVYAAAEHGSATRGSLG